MRDYVIMTDSSCDLSPEMARMLEILVLPLTVHVGGETYRDYLDERERKSDKFYRSLRSGVNVSTSVPELSFFMETIEPQLRAGRDILYLGFSSGLSETFRTATTAAQTMKERYPEANIELVDTLCASLGQGLLVYLCAQEKRKGKSLAELKEYAESRKAQICHWFTVDDLRYLQRGGRVTADAAVVGNALGMKPIMHINQSGQLMPVEEIQGRQYALATLIARMASRVEHPEEQVVFICHGDCQEEADYMANLVRDAFHPAQVMVAPVGPIVGAHAGPGSVAVFFVGNHR